MVHDGHGLTLPLALGLLENTEQEAQGVSHSVSKNHYPPLPVFILSHQESHFQAFQKLVGFSCMKKPLLLTDFTFTQQQDNQHMLLLLVLERSFTASS